MAGKRDEAKRWLTRATSALNASEALVSRKLFDDAISRSYYAMFYAARALLIRDRVTVGSKHSAVIAAFGREYAKTGKIDPRYIRCLSRISSGGKRRITMSSGMRIGKRLGDAWRMRGSSFLGYRRCSFDLATPGQEGTGICIDKTSKMTRKLTCRCKSARRSLRASPRRSFHR